MSVAVTERAAFMGILKSAPFKFVNFAPIMQLSFKSIAHAAEFYHS